MPPKRRKTTAKTRRQVEAPEDEGDTMGSWFRGWVGGLLAVIVGTAAFVAYALNSQAAQDAKIGVNATAIAVHEAEIRSIRDATLKRLEEIAGKLDRAIGGKTP